MSPANIGIESGEERASRVKRYRHENLRRLEGIAKTSVELAANDLLHTYDWLLETPEGEALMEALNDAAEGGAR